MTALYVDPASIDFLQPVLASLRNGANIGMDLVDDVWGCTLHHEDTYLKDDSCFLEAVNALGRLREARKTLNSLLLSLERAHHSIQLISFPAVLARGIDSLSDELLADILVLVGESGWKAALPLSWVSHRFRTVALATPSLWSSMPPAWLGETGHEALSAFLERSKNVRIYVELPPVMTDEVLQNPHWDDALGMLMEHRHRWRELTVDLATAIDTTADGSHNKLQFPEAVLDSVESLNLPDTSQRFQVSYIAIGRDQLQDASPEFYAGWKFPNVRSLTAETLVPPPKVFPNLTKFSLDLSLSPARETDVDVPPGTPSLDALVNFLNSVPTLQVFKLTVGEYSYSAIHHTINLPSVKTLHLENRYAHPASLRVLGTVSRALYLPSVESITLSLSVSHSHELFDRGVGKGCLSRFFPNGRSFHHLKRFRFEYRIDDDPSPRILMETDRYPGLEELEILTSSVPNINLSRRLGLSRRSNATLKSITFRDLHADTCQAAVREYVADGDELDPRSYFERMSQ